MTHLFFGWKKLIVAFVLCSYPCLSNAEQDGEITIDMDGISAKQAIAVLHSFSQSHDMRADQYVIGKWDLDDQKRCKENEEEEFCFADFYLVHISKSKCNPSYLVETRCLNNKRDCELVFHKSRSELCE